VAKRVRVGEQVTLTDGAGAVVHAQVTAVERDRVTCTALDAWDEDRPSLRVTVVQAIPKGDRGELAVELATEVGVDEVVPWQAERCVSRWRGDKIERGRDKWRTVAREAAKQSRRSWWPVIAPVADLSAVVEQVTRADLALVLHEGAETPMTEALTRVGLTGEGHVLLVVGPEGGLSDAEREQLVAAGASEVRLGPTVLRTSTAGAVAATLVLAGSAPWGRIVGVPAEGSARDRDR
jgi:16S rRNA (uracil1498-N3)-methyltransferase